MVAAHYIPILKDKTAEFSALSELEASVKSGLTPLFDILPLDSEESDPWIQKFATRLGKAWPTTAPIYLDGKNIGAVKTSSGGSAFRALVGACNDRGIEIVPVTGLGRSQEYQSAVQQALQRRSEICLRLAGGDFSEGFPEIAASELLRTMSLGRDSAHLLLDFHVIAADMAGLLAMYIANIPQLTSWRTVTIAATSFPEHLGEFGPGTITPTPRLEWKTWLSLHKAKIPCKLQFADYGIQHPTILKFDPKKMRISAQIRYTTDDHWLIVRGRSIKTHGYDQIHALCAKLVARPEFKGADFSAGDAWIAKCATRKVKPGVPQIWRRVGTTHHLTMVVRQLASLVVP